MPKRGTTEKSQENIIHEETKKINLLGGLKVAGYVITTLTSLFFLFFFIFIIFSLFIKPEPILGNVALIHINGVITAEEQGGMFTEQTASSSDIVGYIQKADENPSIKAILLEINSPGGSPVGSKEVQDALRKTNKTTVAYIREIGTSGAYWIASASDVIVADPLSITGSIGVYSSYLEFSGLMQKYNVTYQRLVAGKYKDIGVPYKQLSDEEEGILQDKINKMHTFFIESVAENRKMEKEKITSLATGEFYLGEEAKENGLIDVLGNEQTAIDILKEKLNTTKIELAEYKKPRTLGDLLTGLLSRQFFSVGQGIGSALMESKFYDRINILT